MVRPEMGVSDVVILWGEIEVKTNKALVERSKFFTHQFAFPPAAQNPVM
jgi:hypothetical protein